MFSNSFRVVYNAMIYIYGGYDADGFCSADIFCYSIEQKTWSRVPANKTQVKEFDLERFHHTAVSTENVMLVFGGKDSSGKVCDNKLLEFHYDTNTWSVIQTVGFAPCPRWGHCCAVTEYELRFVFIFVNSVLNFWCREFMYIFGGCDGPSEFADLYQYHFGTHTALL